MFQKAIKAIRRALSLTDPNGWHGSGRISHSGEIVTETSALALSTVWRCCDLLTGTIASLPLMVYRRTDDGGREVAADHWLYRLVHDKANADQSAFDFWQYMVLSLELWGNAFARKEKIGGRIVALTPVAPNFVMVDRAESGQIRYRWTENGKQYDLTEDDVLHIRGMGGAPLGGLSVLSYARHTLGLAAAIDKAAGKTFENGLRPSGTINFDKFLTESQRAIAEEKLIDKFCGTLNAGRPMIMEGGATFTPIMMNPEDAQMLESRRFSVEEICRLFGVPPPMVGHTEKSTSWGTGVEQQTLGFTKFTLTPRLRRIETALQTQLMTDADKRAGVIVEFNIEGLLRGDSANRAAFYTAMVTHGLMSINQVRSLENWPPFEGGDEPRMQMQNVPITTPFSQEPPP